MTCTPFKTATGGVGIICGATKRCRCGNRATLLCDWKMPQKMTGTCDAALCPSCTTSPAPEKDLCPAHAAQWRDQQARR